MLNNFRRHEADTHQFGCGVTAVHQPSFHIYGHTDLHMYMMDFRYVKITLKSKSSQIGLQILLA